MRDTANLFTVEIDMSDLQDTMNAIRDHLTAKKFYSVMASEFKRVRGPIKTALGDDVPKEYVIKASTVRGSVKNAKITTGNGVGVDIPIQGSRGKLGAAGMFSATNGRRGWNINGPYKIKTKMVKSAVSELPGSLPTYGGKPPFRNYSAPSLHNLVFTRMGKSRLPIKPVAGIAIPQMPTNRSEGKVQEDIQKIMEERIEHVYQKVMEGVIKG